MRDNYQSNTAKCHQEPPPFLPDELIFHILLWLPVRFLLQLKCVCKSWKTLISDPQFTKSHLHSITLNPTITHQRLFSSLLINEHCKIVSFPMKPLFENPSEHANTVKFRMEHRFRILGSCNGLLCLFDLNQGYVKLWNPCIRFESKKSPIIDCYDKYMLITYHGFGYDHVNDKYKVLVRVRRGRSRFIEYVTKMYTFGENSWTTIHDFRGAPPSSWIGKFVRGTLNWLIAKKDVNSNQTMILSFDLENETYNEVLLPRSSIIGHDAGKVLHPTPLLGVSSNCLCVCFNSNKTHWDIWLMKKYGVAESWTRLMMIPQRQFPICEMLYSFDDLLFILENGTVLVASPSKSILYNLDNARLNYPSIFNKLRQVPHIYHASLVSPRC
ncbi:unnamed protein product [Trifolium pratense]|uniref:Uncharacterized protein n=1 Tax=Trifolium pratense TaxID=57577 RepID=A0ACB0KYD0_TRIPR|nr:unnamed protein product [Trifolium pratense]